MSATPSPAGNSRSMNGTGPKNDTSPSSFALFPPLPNETYVPVQTERRDIHIPKEASANFKIESFTNREDVLFGLAYDGRCTTAGQQAIMPFRFQVQPEATVAETVSIAEAHCKELAQFEHMGLEAFCNFSLGNMQLSQFQNLLVLANQKVATHPGGQISIPPVYSQKYPLSVICVDNADAIHVHAFSDPAVVEPDLLQMMLLHFTDAVRIALDQPERPVRDLQTLGAEAWKILMDWNKTSSPQDPDTSQPFIVEAIEAQCAKRENAPAISAWDGDLTYGELHQEASHIAGLLIDEAVAPGTFVGIHMLKSKMAVVTMLGIMKSGAAFVFLPPSMPMARLVKMCQITSMQFILTERKLAAQAKKLGPKVIRFPNDMGPAYEMPPYLETKTKPEHPLYAVFTSGSLGEPKAVIVDRASYGSGVQEFCRRTRLGPESRTFQFASYAFVVSVFEHLVALSVGACICIASEEQSDTELEESITRTNADWAILTPSVARTLSPKNIPALRDLLLVGEALTNADREQWKDYLTLYTLYGQSETAATTFVGSLSGQSVRRVTDLGELSCGNCWVVDPEDHNLLKPLGTEGELMIESPSLGLEYINDPKQTAEVFVKRPSWLQQIRADDDPARCVLTGDLVRFRDIQGSIQFVGRKGTRTKIRDQRIELGEVEHHMRCHFTGAVSVVAEVVGITISNHREQTAMLVGFVLDNSSAPSRAKPDINEKMFAPPTSEHRQRARKAIQELRRILPTFMVPSAIIPLTYLPRTVTGKIHRKGLREAASNLPLSDLMVYQWDKPVYTAPRTTEERTLQSICAEVLALPLSEISINDNFFNIGGDSLTARQLVSKARSHRLSLTLTQVFNEATLAALAQCAGKHVPQAESVASLSSGHVDPYRALADDFLANLPSGLAAHDIEDVIPTTEMQTLIIDAKVVDYFPFEIDGSLDKHQLRLACESVVQNNASLRSIFVRFREQIVQVILKRIAVSLYTEVELPENGNQDPIVAARAYCMVDKQNPPPMDQPTARFILFPEVNNKHIFVLRLTHAQYDAVCLQPLADQISGAYNSKPVRVITDFPQYRRECARLRTPQAFNFWKSLLAGAQVTRVPRCPDEGKVGQCDMYIKECSPAAPPTGITMATAIKAAWSFVLRQETGQQDVVFGQVIDGRAMNLDGVQGTVGTCLNTTPIRVNYQTGAVSTVIDLFRLIQHQHVQALEFETLEWKDLVAHCTSWPNETDLDSVILHENFGGGPQLSLGGASGAMLDPIFTMGGWKRHTLVTWPEPGKLKAFLMVRAESLDKVLAERLLADFIQTLVRFLDGPEAQL
ncbi:predicted protein [Uncinocarpus reesii 1704]|uniref:Carrier domain-containing protein n=1 Tax=Uncinocarpus reesii (strain UAMH 1704) TaxID=336963 RepID=C4JN10_UNCRE|nr:uncharacterized protein UREG_04218 [Uncinocarpus reesii 1704]EEP79372.1 predicted protein [Uncinocarpus reesii 1704]